jgi:hypothetical protein
MGILLGTDLTPAIAWSDVHRHGRRITASQPIIIATPSGFSARETSLPARGLRPFCSIADVVESLPLTALLSQALVAFTIEFDNEAEHRMSHHRVTRGSSGPQDGPWLVSMVMWFNCMRHVGEAPITVPELERRARTPFPRCSHARCS